MLILLEQLVDTYPVCRTFKNCKMSANVIMYTTRKNRNPKRKRTFLINLFFFKIRIVLSLNPNFLQVGPPSNFIRMKFTFTHFDD